MKILKISLLVLLIIFIVIQFFGIDKSVPEYDETGDFLSVYNPPSEVETIFRTTCYDCHSYSTVYPWYSNIQPVAWWLEDHIEEGRDEMNLSLWEDYSGEDADHLLEEIVEMVEEEKMPLPSYTWAHADARLTDEQREEFTSWVSDLRSSLELSSDSSTTDHSDHDH